MKGNRAFLSAPSGSGADDKRPPRLADGRIAIQQRSGDNLTALGFSKTIKPRRRLIDVAVGKLLQRAFPTIPDCIVCVQTSTFAVPHEVLSTNPRRSTIS